MDLNLLNTFYIKPIFLSIFNADTSKVILWKNPTQSWIRRYLIKKFIIIIQPDLWSGYPYTPSWNSPTLPLIFLSINLSYLKLFFFTPLSFKPSNTSFYETFSLQIAFSLNLSYFKLFSMHTFLFTNFSL